MTEPYLGPSKEAIDGLMEMTSRYRANLMAAALADLFPPPKPSIWMRMRRAIARRLYGERRT